MSARAALLLDDAAALAARRPGSLLACAALGWLPLYAAGFAGWALVMGAAEPPLLELLALGTLAAGAWMTSCWALAAGVRLCAGELDGAPLALGRALRLAVGDLPRVIAAAAARALISALGLLPAGLGLPYARVLTGGLLPASVLDGGGLRAGLALSGRAAPSFALVSLLSWGASALIWGNLVLAGLTLSRAVDPLRILAPLQGRDELVLRLAAAMLALVLAEPLRVGGLVAAWARDRRERLGVDLLRAAS